MTTLGKSDVFPDDTTLSRTGNSSLISSNLEVAKPWLSSNYLKLFYSIFILFNQQRAVFICWKYRIWSTWYNPKVYTKVLFGVPYYFQFDDTTLSKIGDTNLISNNLDVAKPWFSSNYLKLNDSKTQTILFIVHSWIPASDPVKLLGLILDHFLVNAH